MRVAAFAAASLVALLSMPAAAQDSATVSGRVTNARGQPEGAVLIRIQTLNVASSTAPDGSYRLVVPGSRIRPGQAVTLSASRVGLTTQSRSITLGSGASLTQNFQLAPDALQLQSRRRGAKLCGKGRSKC